jgi:hypothetical protein
MVHLYLYELHWSVENILQLFPLVYVSIVPIDLVKGVFNELLSKHLVWEDYPIISLTYQRT